MAQITDVIQEIAAQALSNGGTSIADNIKEKVVSGITDSIIDSVKQTAQSKNGLDMLTSLISGNGDASNVANQLGSLAGQIFSTSTANKLGLSSSTTSAVTSLLPMIISTLIASKGKFNISDLISIATQVASSSSSSSAAKGGGLASVINVLGKIFKK